MNKRNLLIVGALILVAASFFLLPRVQLAYDRIRFEKENKQALERVKSVQAAPVTTTHVETTEKNSQPLPEQAYLEVPFFCQAPHQNEASWAIHHASCEEAAVLQAVYFQQGIDSVSADTVDVVLRSMLDWQLKHFGVHKDIHADSIKLLMTGFFDYKDDEILIVRDAQIDEIKSWVSKGYPVIAPTYGRWLRNPYYKQPGPEYHMVTVVGYTKERLITNDVGTKRGKDFTYDLDTFKKSMAREGGDCLVILRATVR